jgi:hypothetical protein
MLQDAGYDGYSKKSVPMLSCLARPYLEYKGRLFDKNCRHELLVIIEWHLTDRIFEAKETEELV